MTRRITPRYRLHKKSGRGIVTVYNADGSRRDILLPGDYKSTESRAEYVRILARLGVHGGALPPEETAKYPDLTIAELAARFKQEHVDTYYVNPITKEPTGEQENFRCAIRPLNRLFGDLSVLDFGPRSLVSVRDAMIDGRWMSEHERKFHDEAGRPECLSRNTVNKRIGRIKMMFRWATEMQMIPPAIYHGLLAVRGLAKGRSKARDTDDVPPVAPAIVEQTLPHLPPVVRDIVELLLLTGMRVGEAVVMRAMDIDMTGSVWLYKPVHHKTLWRGHSCVRSLGPRAQEIVRRYLKPNVEAYLFSPAEQQTLINAEKRKHRKTKVQPTQVCRRKASPKKKPGEQFTPDGINNAIERTCRRHNIPKWHTHQLRHTRAREVVRQYGLDAARAVLGQKKVQVTALYVGIDQETAAGVMAEIG